MDPSGLLARLANKAYETFEERFKVTCHMRHPYFILKMDFNNYHIITVMIRIRNKNN